MNTFWYCYKRNTVNKITFVTFAFVLNVLIFASQNQIYSQMSCGQTNDECLIAEATKLIQLNPENPINYYNRGISYRNLGENELAILDYTKAIEIKPDFYRGYFNRSIINYELGKIDEAIEDIIKVLEINPDIANAHFFYGYINFANEKYEKALEEFDRAIELNPKYKKAYQYRAKTFVKLGEKEKAQTDLEILEQIPNSA